MNASKKKVSAVIPNSPPVRKVSRTAAVDGSKAFVNRFLAAYIMGVANRLANGASNYYRTQFNLGMSEWRAMMAIGAEKLEAQFHPADMCLDPAGQIERVVQARGVDCDVEWIAHAALSDVAVGAGKFAAMVFAPLSNVAIRRFSR